MVDNDAFAATFDTEDGTRFAQQNERVMEGLMANGGTPLDPDVIALIDEYASHHAGGLVVLQGAVSPGVYVKVHDSWGDDTNIVVHLYAADDDPMNGALDMVQEFPVSQARHALRALDRLLGREPLSVPDLDDAQG